MNKKPIIVLTGPTAVGKTELSIKLAKHINGEIISADSMQVYKRMDIGTAKIKQDEMQAVKHFLIDELEPYEDFNVTVFKEKAQSAINDIYKRGNIPIIVGGTGFYIQAVLYDIDFTKNNDDKSIREELNRFAEINGHRALWEMLREIDPKSAEAIHENNVKRVIRAIEFYRQTNSLMSSHNEVQRAKESPFNYVYFVLNDHREVLYERIDKRVDEMFNNGLLEEVHSLIKSGLTRENVSMQGIGYKECFDYFDGIISLDKLKDKIKQDTRHFAKRQITWFKREENVCFMNYYDYNYDKDKMLQAMSDILRDNSII